MKLSKMHLKTLREVPNEAEIPSHILMLRSGMIRKLASGVYGFMPLGWRTLRKIEGDNQRRDGRCRRTGDTYVCYPAV